MRFLVSFIVALAFVPLPAVADDTALQGKWDMTSMDGESLEGVEGGFHYTFRADGVLVTETPFTTYDGTWEEISAGRVTYDLMSAMPGVATNECGFAIEGDNLVLSDCSNGSPPATFTRAE